MSSLFGNPRLIVTKTFGRLFVVQLKAVHPEDGTAMTPEDLIKHGEMLIATGRMALAAEGKATGPIGVVGGTDTEAGEA